MIDWALLVIGLVSLAIVSVTLIFIIHLNKSSKKTTDHLDDIMDRYLKNNHHDG